MSTHCSISVHDTERAATLAETILAVDAFSPGVAASVADGIDLEEGYAVQDRSALLATEAGRLVRGFKIGLTTSESRRPLQADEPGSGRIYADRILMSPATIQLEVRPLAFEVELAVRIGADGSIAAWCPAIEIIESRWIGGPPNLGGWVADNASAHSVCLSDWVEGATPETSAAWATFNQQRLTADSSDAMNNLAWLRWHLAERAVPLDSESIVLTGSIIGPVPIPPGGAQLTAGLEGTDPLSIEFIASGD